jgi:DNA/RNA endonuclease YhcR with UshA esterase domain
MARTGGSVMSKVYYDRTVVNKANAQHLMLVRRIIAGQGTIAWASAESPQFTPMHYYEMLITEGERMEILGYYPQGLTTHQIGNLRYRAVTQHIGVTDDD